MTTSLPVIKGNSEVDFIARKFMLQSFARELLPEHRVRICYRHRLPNTEAVQVWHNPERKSARVGGVMKCHNAWVCPVCAGYITQRRREELAQALNNTRKEYVPFMITYTARHNASDSLQGTLDTLLEAYRRFRSGRWWQNMKYEFMLAGSVRATEVTYGQNGWHPHFHELILIKRAGVELGYEYIADALQSHFEPVWLEKLGASGGSGGRGVALDVRASKRDIAWYIAKYGHAPAQKPGWGISDEIARAGAKHHRMDGMTPFGLLFEYGAHKDIDAGNLFRQFAATMKGKSQLHWSRGSKELFGIEIASDQVAAAAGRDSDILLASLSADDWKKVVANSSQSAVIHIAAGGDVIALRNYVKQLT